MIATYAGGAMLVAMIGQSADSSLLDQALAAQADPSISGIAHQAGILASLGMSMPSAAVTVAAAGLIYQVLVLLKPFSITLNDIWRKHALGAEHVAPPKR
jgi:hypothetical protein